MSAWENLPVDLWDAVYSYMTTGEKESVEKLSTAIEYYAADNLTCSAMTYMGSYYDQPEYCEHITLPGTDYCEEHSD